MKTVNVDIADRGYDIRISDQWDLGEAVLALRDRKGLIVSDSNVDPLYGEKFDACLAAQGIETFRLVLEAGEKSKSMQNMGRIYDAALDAGLDRKSVIVALGGGVVGDIAGFAAATFMRGIKFVQVPTSLLAMVDSSVGGKTAVNLERGKNLVGSFYQPVEVDIALDVLKTLPEREFSAGMAEVIKYGVIWDASFFAMLETEIAGIMERDRDVLANVVSRCCEIKAEVVAVDEKEAGVRGILNFGHTLGHAIENLRGYGECLHGEAVSLGMIYAMRVSVLTKSLDPAEEQRLRTLLVSAGLPTDLSDCGDLAWSDIRRVMLADKKTEEGIPRFVLADRMGSVIFGCEVSEDVLQGAFDALVAEGSQ